MAHVLTWAIFCLKNNLVGAEVGVEMRYKLYAINEIHAGEAAGRR